MSYQKSIYDAVSFLFGGGLANDLQEWMNDLFTTILAIVDGGLVTSVLAALSAVACSLLILYFFMDLMDQAKRDMFSFEKMIIAFIKFLAAVVVLICLPDLIKYLVQIGHAVYQFAANDDTISGALVSGNGNAISLFPDVAREDMATMPPWDNNTQDAFTDALGKGVTGFLGHVGLWVECMIINLIGMIMRIVGFFLCASNALWVLVRATFSPFAVVQLFEDGSRSSGMRYLKGFAADCITMAVYVVILLAASAVTNGLVQNYIEVSEITFENMETIIDWSTTAILLVPQLVAVGAMGGGGKVAHDIMGA